MFRSKLALYSSISVLVGSALIVGCGDDDGDGGDGSGAMGGDGGARAGTGGGGRSGGTGGTAGSGGAKGGTGGVGTGGTQPQPQGGQGGDPGGTGGIDAGAGGDAGSGGKAPVTFGAVERVGDTVVPSVHDLRGLTYAANGKIYASGHIGADSKTVDRELAVVRFNANGTLDNSFGVGGIVRHNLRERDVDIIENGAGGAGGGGGEGGGGGTTEVVVNDGDEQSIGIVELEDGDLLVQANVRDAAGKGVDVVLVRLDSKGDFVDSFGDDGVQRIDLGWTEADNASWDPSWTPAGAPADQSWGLELDPSSEEEKVVVFAFGPAKLGALSTANPPAQRTDNDRYVVRVLASDGSIDPDFNDGKVFTLHTGGTFSDGARRGLVEEDGSIVSAGYTNFGEGLGNHIVLIRLTPDGKVDPSFRAGIGLPGVVRSNPFIDDGGIAECYAVGKQSNGRYVTVGYGRATLANTASSMGWATTDGVDLVAAGLLPDGLDSTYGHEGGLAIQSEEANLGNTEDRGRDLVVLPDDRAVFVGRFGPNPAIFVTTPDGELDTDSGEDGRITYEPFVATAPNGDPIPTSHFYRVSLSGDKKRIAAVTNNHVNGVRIAVLGVTED